jgi:hypothetical protein
LLRSRRVWLGIVLSAVFIAVFLLRTDFDQIGDAFADANYWWAAASIPVYFAGSWFRAWRWHFLMRPVKEVSTVAVCVVIGFMGNNLLLCGRGEFARAYIIGEREGKQDGLAGHVALDRVFDGICLAFLFIAGAIAARATAWTIAVSMTALRPGALLLALVF